ncbi:MAG: MATE family efflux transporter [Oscillospiraceae bacterium]|jgi:putative MATE family efflux protein|nr:MATE family efflux transporter [Oscillospiraceae bacterium]
MQDAAGKTKNSGKDMTSGGIAKLLISFSLPLMLGGVLQGAYNAFDSMVVGNFVSKSALAAVGMALPIHMIIIGFFMGLSSGAAVLTARFFGAKDDESLKAALHTALLIAVVMGIMLAVAGVLVMPALLRFMNTPQEVFSDAATYFTIFCYGLPALTVYNMGTAVLNAFGESKKPLIYLAIAAAVNIVLNLVFVIVFDRGVAGVAIATVISELISMLLVLNTLRKPGLPCNIDFRYLRTNFPILKQMLRLGLPIGSQCVVQGISNVLLQIYINGLGTSAVAGWGVTGKINAFIYPVSSAVSLGITTFVGQNLGAGNVDRARRGVTTALIIAVSITLTVTAILLLLNVRVLRIFTTDNEVLDMALSFMKILTATYFMQSFLGIWQNALACGGTTISPMIADMATHVGLRQLYLFVISIFFCNPTTIALSYPVAWVPCGVILFIMYRRSDWNSFKKKLSA